MKCPNCDKQETKVIDSRNNQSGVVIRRRRICDDCGYRFTTYERIEEIVPLVIKSDGRREPFNRDKIMGGVTKATQKRPIKTSVLENLVDEVIKSLQEMGEKEIDSKKIGYIVMNKIRLLDEVAYIRFASVYRHFKDIEEFVTEIQEQKDHPIEDPETKNLPFPKARKDFNIKRKNNKSNQQLS